MIGIVSFSIYFEVAGREQHPEFDKLISTRDSLMSRDSYKSVLRRSGNVYILYNNKNTENIYHAAVGPTRTTNQIPS